MPRYSLTTIDDDADEAYDAISTVLDSMGSSVLPLPPSNEGKFDPFPPPNPASPPPPTSSPQHQLSTFNPTKHSTKSSLSSFSNRSMFELTYYEALYQFRLNSALDQPDTSGRDALYLSALANSANGRYNSSKQEHLQKVARRERDVWSLVAALRGGGVDLLINDAPLDSVPTKDIMKLAAGNLTATPTTVVNTVLGRSFELRRIAAIVSWAEVRILREAMSWVGGMWALALFNDIFNIIVNSFIIYSLYFVSKDTAPPPPHKTFFF